MAQDMTNQPLTNLPNLPNLKPQPIPEPKVFRGDEVLPPTTAQVQVPEGAVMLLPSGDWCDKAAALLVLEAEGKRALAKSLNGTHQDPAGAAARDRNMREFHRLLSADNLKEISRRLYGNDKSKWFRLEDLKHPEVRVTGDDGQPVEVEWNPEG
jgi:hypothetical protein